MDVKEVKKEIVKFSKLMYEKDYVAASEGNISCRISENRILITPSKMIKKFLKGSDLVEINMEGEVVKGSHKPTTERFTHIEIYKQNPDIKIIADEMMKW